jgi:hypothetical protein
MPSEMFFPANLVAALRLDYLAGGQLNEGPFGTQGATPGKPA